MRKINKIILNELINSAHTVRLNAYAPYSDFKVGAALLSEKNNIYSGANIENSSYPVSICAERSALSSAISNGERSFKAICVSTESEKPAPPCGACRQALSEFCDDLIIISVTDKGLQEKFSLKDLLPHKFHGKIFLKK